MSTSEPKPKMELWCQACNFAILSLGQCSTANLFATNRSNCKIAGAAPNSPRLSHNNRLTFTASRTKVSALVTAFRLRHQVQQT